MSFKDAAAAIYRCVSLNRGCCFQMENTNFIIKNAFSASFILAREIANGKAIVPKIGQPQKMLFFVHN